MGIPSEGLEKPFKIDVHYSTKGTSDEKGTGLGLILFKEIIEKHGGVIKVNSESGKGTEVSFTLNAMEKLNLKILFYHSFHKMLKSFRRIFAITRMHS